MSKRNNINRPGTKPYFAEVRQAESESDSPNELPSFIPPIVVKNAVQDAVEEDEDDDDCDVEASYISKAGAFLYGCCEKTTAFSKSATTSTWNTLCKIPSYCVLRWDSEESTESDEATKAAVKLEGGRSTMVDEDEYDEDEAEHTSSRWWGIGIKMAATLAAVLIIGVGIVAFKPLLYKLLEQSPVEIADNSPVGIVSDIESGHIHEEPEMEPLVPQSLDNDVFANNPGTSLQSIPNSLEEHAVFGSLEQSNSLGSFDDMIHVGPGPGMEPITAFSNDEDVFVNTLAPAEASVSASLDEPLPPEPPADLLSGLAALQPLTPVELPTPDVATPDSILPQLQPLSTMEVPALANALPSAPIASDFYASPTPPAIHTLVPMTAQPTIPIIENVKEIVPMIPSSGLIEEVPPPPPAPVLAETIPVQPAYPNEFAPAIPTDATAFALALAETTPPQEENGPGIALHSSVGTTDTHPNAENHHYSLPVEEWPKAGMASVEETRYTGQIDEMVASMPVPIPPNEIAPLIPRDGPQSEMPVVAVPPVAVAESTPRILPAGSQPMDWQLWEQIRGLRDEGEQSASNLRFDNTTSTVLATAPPTAEPALRFEPRNSTLSNATLSNAPPTNEVGQLLNDAMQELNGLMPMDVAMSDAADIVGILSDSGRVPPPVFADPRPAYRNETANQLANAEASERSLTFQSQIDAEISRSPAETQKYVIQQGDTYMSISDRFYGTSLLYTALAAHNQRQGIGWRPAEGMSIEVPPADYLREQYGEIAQRQVRQMNTQQASVRYIVQEGDTIFRLATDKLRDSSRWREIYALNADRLQDARTLTPGMEILLPAETARR